MVAGLVVWLEGNLSLNNTSFTGNTYTTGSFQAADYVLGSSAYMGMWAMNGASDGQWTMLV